MYEAALKLVTKWLRNPPSGNSLYASLISPYVSPVLWVFLMFSLVFLPVSYFISYESTVNRKEKEHAICYFKNLKQRITFQLPQIITFNSLT